MADLPDERRRLREDALILGQALADRRAEDPLLTFDPFPKQQAFITSVLRNLKQENWLVTANRFGKCLTPWTPLEMDSATRLPGELLGETGFYVRSWDGVSR